MIRGRVSIIVPCYNAAKYLDDAINSLLSQTHQDVEVLAVNDGSTDATQEKLEQQAAGDSRVRIFAQKNSGPSAARNTAMRDVQGEFVCFLDADDIFLPDKIERQVGFLRDHPQVDLVYSDYYTGDSQLNLTALSAVRIKQTDMVEAFAVGNRFPPLVPMFRRGMMDAVGEFDESLRMAEDWDYWIRCARAGTFAYLPGPSVIYRTHSAQAHHNIHRMFLGGKRVLKTHFRSDPPRYQRALASWYERNAKEQWNSANHAKAGLLLALSAFHSKMAGAAEFLFRPRAFKAKRTIA